MGQYQTTKIVVFLKMNQSWNCLVLIHLLIYWGLKGMHAVYGYFASFHIIYYCVTYQTTRVHTPVWQLIIFNRQPVPWVQPMSGVKRYLHECYFGLSSIFIFKNQIDMNVINFLSNSNEKVIKIQVNSVKFGTVMGVFVPCLQSILGIIYYIRFSW